jgi:hypothetical protein
VDQPEATTTLEYPFADHPSAVEPLPDGDESCLLIRSFPVGW